MRLTRPFAVVALALGLAACSGNPRPLSEATVSVNDLTTTHIRNVNSFPLTIYLTQAGMRHRLGVVESMSNAMFMVPPKLMNGRLEFRLLASPLGPHPTYISETFQLRAGQTADWRLQETTSRQASLVSLVSVR